MFGQTLELPLLFGDGLEAVGVGVFLLLQHLPLALYEFFLWLDFVLNLCCVQAAAYVGDEQGVALLLEQRVENDDGIEQQQGDEDEQQYGGADRSVVTFFCRRRVAWR